MDINRLGNPAPEIEEATDGKTASTRLSQESFAATNEISNQGSTAADAPDSHTDNENAKHEKFECANGFPKPGAFNVSLHDLNEEIKEIKNRLQIDRRPERIESAILHLAGKSDVNCDGILSKDELRRFQSTTDVAPETKQLAGHLLDNFELLSTFNNSAANELSSPVARKIAKDYLNDEASSEFISAADLSAMRSLSPMARPFLEMKIGTSLVKELEQLSQETRNNVLNELEVFFNKKIAQRQKLLSW